MLAEIERRDCNAFRMEMARLFQIICRILGDAHMGGMLDVITGDADIGKDVVIARGELLHDVPGIKIVQELSDEADR